MDADAVEDLEIVRSDVLTGDGLEQALADIEVAYYLIHSMERAAAAARTSPSATASPRRTSLALRRARA